MNLTAIDLFSGAGGFSLGLVQAGFTILGALDNWLPAVNTYRSNFTHPVIHEDIRSLSAPEFMCRIGRPGSTVDLVVGGPPCQGFSIQRIGEDHDDRNPLVLDFARFVIELAPRMFLMENVPGLLGKRGRHVAKEFERALKTVGFEVCHRLVNAAECDVPQIRRRVLFWGWRKGEVPFAMPIFPRSEAEFPTVRSAIADLPSPDREVGCDPLHRRTRLSDLNITRLKLIPPGGGFESLPPELRVNCHRSGAAKIGHRYVYGRLAPDEPAATITARFDSFTRGKFAHPWEDRNLTLREGARLQSFPDSYIFTGTQEQIAAQIGNAVPPRVASFLGNAIREHFCGTAQLFNGATVDQFRLFTEAV